MTKALRILDDVADRDVPQIVAYHLPKSKARVLALLAEYDSLIDLLGSNPRAFHPRPHGWRVGVFRNGTYALYYPKFRS